MRYSKTNNYFIIILSKSYRPNRRFRTFYLGAFAAVLARTSSSFRKPNKFWTVDVPVHCEWLILSRSV